MMDRIAGPWALVAMALGTVLAVGWPATGVAQPLSLPSVDEIVRKLQRPHVAPDALANSAIAIEGQRTRVEPAAAIDLAVNFEFASAVLTPDARLVLDNLGRALADPELRDARFRVAGHTDARGSDAYNLALSRRRAQSAVNYLVQQHHVEPLRLQVEGFGRSQLLDPANPESVVNRRVQITNLGP